MSEKAGPSVDGQEAEKPVSPESTDESSAAGDQERAGNPAAGEAESRDGFGQGESASSSESASETAEVDPPVPREDSSTDSDVDLNADTVTQRGAGTYLTESTDLGEEAARGWHEGDLVANQYRIHRLIGQGGMGKVYLAQDEALDRPVALKRIPQEIILDVDARDDLRLEANRLLDLAHDNIIRIHTYSDDRTWPFFAMEYLEGQTLKHLLRQRKREGRTFEAEELLVIVRQVGDGLAHAHARNVVHRDLKPANLMLAKPVEGDLDPSDIIKITDFGISRVVADSTLRQTGKRSGTVPYMSPEQFRGEVSTPRSDIYSFACTLYELVAGSPPFYTGDIGYQIMNIEPVPLEGMPRTIAETILRGLSKEPGDRFESVDDFVAAIEGRKIPGPGKQARGPLGTIAKMAVGVLLAFGVLWWAAAGDSSGKGEEPGRGAGGEKVAGSIGNPDSATTGIREPGTVSDRKPETPLEKKTRTDTFRAWLAEALEKQLPLNVGRDYGELITGELPSLDIRLSFPRAEAPQEDEMLQSLVFLATLPGDSESPEPHMVRGQLDAENGVYGFHFQRLVDGTYNLAAFVEDEDKEKGLALPQGQSLLERQFVVDLVAPAFEVMVTDPLGLVETGAGDKDEFTTFEEALVVRLDTSGNADIKEAWYSLLTQDGASSEERVIEDISQWEINYLTPGESRTVRVFAEDKAGNRSETREVTFRRLKLELEEFGTVDIVGNIATVKGKFKVEGAIYPDLQFFVNGERVDAEWSIVRPPPVESARDAAAGEDDPGLVDNPVLEEPAAEERPDDEPPDLDPDATRIIPFVADITLGKAVNVVLVQYSWKDRAPVPFGKAGTLDRVQARAPGIVLRAPNLEPLAEPGSEAGGEEAEAGVIYTREATIAIEGVVDTLFAGLKIKLWVQNSFGSSTQEMKVDPAAGGPGGRFKSDLELLPGEETVIGVRCFFNNDEAELTTVAEPLEVYFDQEAPTAKISARESGDQLLVTVQAAEKLTRLRGRLGAPDGGGVGRWTDVSLSAVQEAGEPVYTWSIPLQVRAVPILFEMTDHAGNVAERRFDYSPPLSEPMPEGSERPVVGAGSKPVQAGTIILRSRFLREVGMDFVVCGPSRLEMGKTEIPESCWFRFLNEKGLRGPDERVGKRENPMVLANQPVELIAQFVEWFGEQAADGYSYSLPTAEQWLCSFAGARTQEKAAGEIKSWFVQEDGFVFQQSERYGQNKVSRIGTRPGNATTTGLLDMEGNLQEIVLDSNGLHVVIGGHNQLADPDRISRACLVTRNLDEDQRELLGGFTGFRICRQPVSDR